MTERWKPIYKELKSRRDAHRIADLVDPPTEAQRELHNALTHVRLSNDELKQLSKQIAEKRAKERNEPGNRWNEGFCCCT